MFSTAAVVGRLHEMADVPCQDAAGGRRVGAVTAIALADGAGSAARSERGAQLAVSAALDLLTSSFDSLYGDELDAARERIIAFAVARIAEAAEIAAAPVSAFASTLLFVAVKDNRFIAGHIGDGIIAHERGGQREVLSRPQRGEHINETIFVTSRRAESNLALQRGQVEGVSAFAVMSDGTAESLYLRQDGTAAPALTSMWQWLDAHAPEAVSSALARNLRDQLRVSTGDDCSLALLRRVKVMPEQLTAMDTAFARAFLECRSSRGIRNRLAVLAALQVGDAPISMAALSARSSLSVSAVRRHVRYLRQLEDPFAPTAPTTNPGAAP